MWIHKQMAISHFSNDLLGTLRYLSNHTNPSTPQSCNSLAHSVLKSSRMAASGQRQITKHDRLTIGFGSRPPISQDHQLTHGSGTPRHTSWIIGITKRAWLIYLYVSKSREKSYGTSIRQHPSNRSSSTFSFCVWVPVCATLACWQVSKWDQKCSGSNPRWSLSGGPNIQPYQQG